jgi:hypothetical protein
MKFLNTPFWVQRGRIRRLYPGGWKRNGLAQPNRLLQLNEVAIQQMKSLLNNTAIKKLSR